MPRAPARRFPWGPSPSRSRPKARADGAPGRFFAFLLLTALAAGLACRPSPPGPPPLPSVGRTLERELRPGEIHRFPVSLAAGDFLELAVDQRQLDVVLTLEGPDGRVRLRVDRPDGRVRPESLVAVAAAGGRFEVTLRGFEPAAHGRYRLTPMARRPATERDRRRAGALARFAVGKRLEKEHQPLAAEEAYGEAARAWRDLGDPTWSSLAFLQQGPLLQDLSRPAPAEQALRQSLADARAVAARDLEAKAWRALARLLDREERPAEAKAALRQARALFHDLGRTASEAEAVNALAKRADRAMELGPAEDGYREALRLYERAGDPLGQAKAWLNLGFLEARLGDAERAQLRFDKVRELLPRLPPADEALWHEGEATALEALGRTAEARADWLRALMLRRREPPGPAPFNALSGLAQVAFQGRRFAVALALSEEALRISRGRPRDEAAALQNVATCAWSAGDLDRAFRLFRQAESLARQSGMPQYEAAAESGLARVAFDRGDLAGALREAEAAIAKIEGFRSSTSRLDLRTALFADYQGHFDLAIDILLRQNGAAAWSPWADRALAMSERSRSRRLLDVLALPAATGLARPVGRPEVERELLDDRTALVEFDLGAEHAVAFVLTKEGRRLFRLPPAATIEGQARRFYAALKEPPSAAGRRAEEAARALAASLLPQLAAALAGKSRLWIVPDGALQSIPFEALAWPEGSPQAGRLLLETHEVVSAPSASVAYWLHRLPPRSAVERLYLVADPVFALGPQGEPVRAAGADSRARSVRSMADLDATPLAPLAFAGREADAILALVPPALRREARGFAASRALVLGGALARAQILHFATHGLFDPRRPELSWIALSRFDPAGRRIPGYVTPADIQKLRIEADLVVLSACQTALGKEVPGEGLLGLSHAFFEAGARSTVVSLWKVDDEATYHLMESFYRRLLAGGHSPADALRQAKLALLRQRKAWQRPWFWAGFIVQGDGFYTDFAGPGFPFSSARSPGR